MPSFMERFKALLLSDAIAESERGPGDAVRPGSGPEPTIKSTATPKTINTPATREPIDPIRGPKVKFARFVGGQLELFTAYTSEISYIAVSHVFGKTGWYRIPGIADEVLASSAKATFIEKQLPGLVGSENFWMDILTVNQRSQSDIISVVQAIPRIFRDASRTLAIRENDGFYPCCEEALTNFATYGEFSQKLMNHNTKHAKDLRGEAYLQRLWTLQECMLSQTIQFVVCREGESRLPDIDDGVEHFYRNQTDTQRLADTLWVLSYSFGGPGPASIITDFIHAYIHCQTITRRRPLEARTAAEDIHTGHFRANNMGSHRSASMPRDYIFATMPQFPWYHYPSNAENMPFSDIFCDLYDQALRSDHGFAPRITASMTNPEITSYEEAWLPSTKQPEPRTLGDFLKLLGNRLPAPGELPAGMPHAHVTSKVNIVELDGFVPAVILGQIKESMEFSPHAWRTAHLGGNLSAHGSFPDPEWEVNWRDAARLGFMVDPKKSRGRGNLLMVHHGEGCTLTTGPTYEYEPIDDQSIPVIIALDPWEQKADYTATSGIVKGYVSVFQQARIILDNMWCAQDDQVNSPSHKADLDGYMREMRGRWSRPLLYALALLAAMVGCDIGLSAADWTHEHFVPVAMSYGRGRLLLGLLARHGRSEKSEERGRRRAMLSVGQHPKSPQMGTDLVLVDPEGPQEGPVGLIPDFLPSAVNYSDEEYEERMTTLYGSFCQVVGPGNVGIRFQPVKPIFDAVRVARKEQTKFKGLDFIF